MVNGSRERVRQRDALFHARGKEGTPLGSDEELWNSPLGDAAPFDRQADLYASWSLKARRVSIQQSMLVCGVISIASGLLCFVLVETISTLQHFENSSLTVQVLIYLPMLAFWLFGGCSIVFFGWTIVSLPQTPGVSLQQYCKMKEDLGRTTSQAIRDYLNSYPLTDVQRRHLIEFGKMSESEVSGLYDKIKCFRKAGSDEMSKSDWLEKVRTEVVAQLDEAARKMVNAASIRVGVATAVSKRGALDLLIMLVGSFHMTSQLCRLYGIRPRTHHVGQLLFMAFTSGLAAKAANTVIEENAENLNDSIQSAMGTLTGAVAGKLTSVLGEGLLNAMLVKVMGRRLIEFLSPISR